MKKIKIGRILRDMMGDLVGATARDRLGERLDDLEEGVDKLRDFVGLDSRLDTLEARVDRLERRPRSAPRPRVEIIDEDDSDDPSSPPDSARAEPPPGSASPPLGG